MEKPKSPEVKKEKLKLFTIIGIIVTAVAFTFAWDTAVIQFLIHVIKNPMSPEAEFLGAVILAPFWEELAFRVIPIKIATSLDSKLGTKLLWPVIGIASLWFGLGHPYAFEINLLTCATFGLMQSYVYLKTQYSYAAIVLVHMLVNFIIIYV